jgi:predicted aspartyl protease
VPLQLVLNNTKLAIPATLDQSGLMLIVDTGSERTVLSETAVQAGEQTSGVGFISGIGGSRGAGLAMLRKLEIGRLHGSVAAVVTEFNASLQQRGFSGLLGMDIMGAYDIDLDVRGGQARFYHAEGACRIPRAVLAQPLYSVAELPAALGDARPHVAVGIAGQTFNAALDTGAQGLLISARAARRLGLDDTTMAADRTLAVNGVGRRTVTGHLHLLDSLVLGELTVRRVPALIMPENFDPTVDVLLGIDIVKRIHFWLSASSHQLVMQYPPASPSAPAP